MSVWGIKGVFDNDFSKFSSDFDSANTNCSQSGRQDICFVILAMAQS
jgi:hypothetical protein